MSSLEQGRLSRRGAEILLYPGFTRASVSDFAHPQSVLFIHGFTADSRYLEDLLDQFSREGFRCFAFNYPCFDGIDEAARSLKQLLELFEQLVPFSVSANRLTVVCHSMGGLVARALVAFENGDRFVKKIVTLGTPHLGTLKNSRFLNLMLDWSENLAGFNPNKHGVSGRSAKQLIGEDEAPTLIEKLKRHSSKDVSYLSVSGSLNWIEFGRNPLKNAIANKWIQIKMKGATNDGLVAEDSSTITNCFSSTLPTHCIHHVDYTDYGRTNHSNLITNQQVALWAMAWSKNQEFDPSNG